jgi:Ca2+-transporting ATPase
MTATSNIAGLTSAEAKERQETYGKNELTSQKKDSFFKKAFHIVCEPMFLLLMVTAVFYFILGEPRDGAVMLIFVAIIVGIDVVQEWKTDRTLNALKDLSAPHIPVIRDGKEQIIASADLVPGDLMLLCEGVKIPADGVVLRCADLCVDESSLTGEAEGVWKTAAESAEPPDDYWRKDYCYAGTLVIQGTASVQVDNIGAATEYGKIGRSVASAPQENTPLQKQINALVRTCAVLAGDFFFWWESLPG